jgi:hypothetical protein
VIARHPQESGKEFAERAAERIARFTSTGWTPRTALLALSARPVDADRDARPFVARALLASLRGRNGATLLIVGDRALPSAARADVFTLAEALRQTSSATSLVIRVQLTDESVMHPTAPTPPAWRDGRPDERSLSAPCLDA